MSDASNTVYTHKRYLYLVAAVATIGGLLFGYDTAVISGAIIFLKTRFALSPLMEGWAVSCVLIGCIAGVSFAGALGDRYGRKKGLLLAALLFTLSALGCALAPTFSGFVASRFMGGVGVGIASMLSPVYLAEIAPPQIRGRLVAMNQLAIIVGMLLTYIVNWLLLDTGAENWRYMFAAMGVPSFIFLFALLLVPESPRWLAKTGRGQESQDVLTRVGGEAYAKQEMKGILASFTEEYVSLRSLFAPGLRLALFVGVVLAVLTQVTGINTILYYTPKIFLMAGFASANDAYLNALAVGVVNVFFSVLAVFTVDVMGRRLLLIIATAGMGVFLGLMGLFFYIPGLPKGLAVVATLGYVAFFMYGLGPGFWVLVSEIYPNRIRGRALSIVTLVLWSSTFVVAQTFPMLTAAVGECWTFWLYGIMCVLALGFVLKYVPETKGKPLEEIENLWHSREVPLLERR